ncbi:hypothetical protein SynRS9915_01735 [Synechococcus sp. RS9915]|nr:hypothetical protein SynRS9915_01735 [Synechococcus sp. RS9915]QNJ17182.1 hypothetical protein SynA1840_01643 [Synechococcus sp. A18-40]
MFFFLGCNKDCGINISATLIPFLLLSEGILSKACWRTG